MSSPKPIASLIREQIARILNRDGPFHVRGQFFPNGLDADKQRHWQAEREVHEALRLLGCAWCHHPIEKGTRVTEVGCRLIHAVPCLREFDEFAYGPTPPSEALAGQLEASVKCTIPGEGELVEWGEWLRVDGDGEKYVTEMVPLSELSCYERHMLEVQPDGHLAGGFPI